MNSSIKKIISCVAAIACLCVNASAITKITSSNYSDFGIAAEDYSQSVGYYAITSSTDLKDFANKFRVTIAEHSLKTSGYFEISCYNLILRYYEKKGYTLEVMNVQSDGFKFKCGPYGYISNFSYFKTKNI